MAKLQKKPARDLEFEPDAWSCFERAVDVVAKSPPQHRTKAKRPFRNSAKPTFLGSPEPPRPRKMGIESSPNAVKTPPEPLTVSFETDS